MSGSEWIALVIGVSVMLTFVVLGWQISRH